MPIAGNGAVARPRDIAFAGAVLCGGASRRMGRDKALLEIEGQAMAVRVASALIDAGAEPVVAVGGNADALATLGLAGVADEHPGEGPLGGLVSALRASPEPVVFVAACDLTSPSASAIATTVGALAAALADPGEPRDPSVAVPVVDGRRQWMHAAWRTAAEAPLRAAFAAGERAVHAAVSVGRLRVIDIELPDPDPAVADADTPADLP
jgi:molybdopterin-guanine dinucleotide biosynthesis protein A